MITTRNLVVVDGVARVLDSDAAVAALAACDIATINALANASAFPVRQAVRKAARAPEAAAQIRYLASVSEEVVQGWIDAAKTHDG